jgi:hypothetical protein
MMVEEKLEAEQDLIKCSEEEESIRRLRLLEESRIVKLFSKVKGDLIIREETRRSLIYRLIRLRRLLLILLK